MEGEGGGGFSQWLLNHKWGIYYIYLYYLKKCNHFLLNLNLIKGGGKENDYVIMGEWVDQWLQRGWGYLYKFDYIKWEWSLILYLNTPIRFL